MTSTGTSLGKRWSSVAIPLAVLRLTGQATEFAAWVVLARRLGSSSFGYLAVGFLLARYAGLIADWGASFRGARDVAADGRHGSIRGYVKKRTRRAIGLSILVVVVALAIGQPQLAPLAIVSLSLGLSRDWIAMGLERGARAGIPLALQGGIVLGASFLATSVSGAALALAVGYGAAAVVSILLNRLPASQTFDHHGPNTHVWILAAVLANQVTSSADTVMLSLLKTSSDAGIYAAIYRLPNAWLAVLTLLLSSLLPLATRSRHDDRQRHVSLRNRSMRLSALGAGLVLVITPVTWMIVPSVFGAQYTSGRTALVILMVATAVITLSAPLHPFAMAAGHDRSYALILMAGAGGNIVANMVAVPAFGMPGAATTTLVSQAAVGLLLWRLVNRASLASESTMPSPRVDEGQPGYLQIPTDC